MNNNIKSIIRHMRQFVRSYRLVKMVDKAAEDIEREHAAKTPPQLKGFKSAHIVTLSVKIDFIQKYKGFDMPKMNRIVADAIKKDYLDGTTLTFNKEEMDALCVTDKGRKLLDLPIGTLEIFMDEYGKATSFLMGSFITGLVIWLWHIINLYL